MSKKQCDERTTAAAPDTTTALVPATTDELIEQMKADADKAQREKILNAMNPACRAKLKSIEAWLRTEQDHILRSRYELGMAVRELYEDEQKGGTVYGKNAIDKICRVLRWDDGLIRLALRFVQAYTPAQLDALCATKLPKGDPLTWSHVRILLAVKSPSRRQELLEKTKTEGLTCMQLDHEVKAAIDGKAGDGRGRPPRVPRGFDDAVADQQAAAEAWDRKYSKVWGDSTRSLAAHAGKLDSSEVTVARLRQAQELAHQLRHVATQAARQADEAEQVVRELEQKLADQKSDDVKG